MTGVQTCALPIFEFERNLIPAFRKSRLKSESYLLATLSFDFAMIEAKHTGAKINFLLTEVCRALKLDA